MNDPHNHNRSIIDLETALDVMKRPNINNFTKSYDQFRDTYGENACVVAETQRFKPRTGKGKRCSLSARLVLWLHVHGELFGGSFAAPSCGVAACVNPRHQRLAVVGGGFTPPCEKTSAPRYVFTAPEKPAKSDHTISA